MLNTIIATTPETLSSDLCDGVLVVSVCDLLDALLGEDHYLTPYEETGAVLREWCELYGASYYAEPREDFSENAGVSQALREGNEIVVVEDLS